MDTDTVQQVRRGIHKAYAVCGDGFNAHFDKRVMAERCCEADRDYDPVLYIRADVADAEMARLRRGIGAIRAGAEADPNKSTILALICRDIDLLLRGEVGREE